MEKEIFNNFVEQIFKECQNKLTTKSHDYAKTENRFSCFENSSNIAEITPEQSILNLIGIKIERLKNLTLNNKEPKNESIEDNLIDLINYSILYVAKIKDLK